MSDLPKGFTCECGKRHLFGIYVYAHWREDLLHTCEDCGRRHSVIAGSAKLVEDEPQKPKKRRPR